MHTIYKDQFFCLKSIFSFTVTLIETSYNTENLHNCLTGQIISAYKISAHYATEFGDS